MIVTIVVFILTIGFLVLIHEGGHLIAAKLAGMWVHQFAIGFGPRLLRFKLKETEYSIRLLPIGGYVRIAGEEEAEEDKGIPEDRMFYAKPPLTRMSMVLAGPLMNIVAAIVIMVMAVTIIGTPYLEVFELSENSPSTSVLQKGDRIIALEGKEVYFLGQVQQLVQEKRGDEVELEIQRGEEIRRVSVRPKWSPEDNRYLIGVYFTGSQETRKIPFPDNVMIGLVWVKNIIAGIYQTIKGVISGLISPKEAFTGPVGIASIVGQSLALGLLPFFTLVAFLSLIIGVINLMPFPALDGSRVFFLLYEIIRGKPIPPEKEGLVHYIGFMILIGLMILITYNDIIRLISGGP